MPSENLNSKHLVFKCFRYLDVLYLEAHSSLNHLKSIHTMFDNGHPNTYIQMPETYKNQSEQSDHSISKPVFKCCIAIRMLFFSVLLLDW